MGPHFIITVFAGVYLLQLAASLALEVINRVRLVQAGDQVPGPFRGFIDAEKMRQMNAYSLEKSRVFLIEKPTFDAVLLALILFGGVKYLSLFSSELVENYVLAGLVFFVAFGAFFFFLGLPFDYYATFSIEERFGFNRSDLGTWAADKGKEAILSVILLLALAGPILWIIDRFPHWWWFWGLLAASLIQFILVVAYPVIIAPLFNKFELLKDESLAEKVEDLACRVGMKVDGIFQMDAGKRSTHSNAYFTGFGRTRRVVLFDTLLSTLSHDEVLGVLAHELGHFKRRHILKSYIAGQAVLLAGFYFTYLMLSWEPLYATFDLEGSQSYALLLIVGIFWQRLGFFVKPLSMMLARRFERQADAFAVELRGKAAPLVSALKKLAEHNLSNLNPHPLYVWFYYSHPPLAERISTMEHAGGSYNSDCRD